MSPERRPVRGLRVHHRPPLVILSNQRPEPRGRGERLERELEQAPPWRQRAASVGVAGAVLSGTALLAWSVVRAAESHITPLVVTGVAFVVAGFAWWGARR